MNLKRCGGESGIRTHGRLRVAGFQDRFLQPLGHLSTWEKICPTVRALEDYTIPLSGLSTTVVVFSAPNFLPASGGTLPAVRTLFPEGSAVSFYLPWGARFLPSRGNLAKLPKEAKKEGLHFLFVFSF